ncbi:MAG: alpha/beta fold hydrolase [Chloroflexota bacterium]|nr:MAG: alpha/beta fold hydrolase [Chloroflexota bacterium]
MKTWLKVLLIVLGVIVLIVVVGLLLVTRGQAANLVTSAPDQRQANEETPADYDLPYEDVTVANDLGQELAGWYIPSENGAVVMLQHGYKSRRQWQLNEARTLHDAGYGALLTTVRAHDESEGELISFGYHEMADLAAWHQFLLTRDEIDPEKIGMLGVSMGGSLVLQYASQNEAIKAVISHSPFSSLDDTVETSVRYFLDLPEWTVSVIVPLVVFWGEQIGGFDSAEIDAKEWIDDISPRPVFLLDAGQDVVVSADSTELLRDAAEEPKYFWQCPECDHAALDVQRADQFEACMLSFYDRYLLGQENEECQDILVN